jgi:hypothetical protein
MIEANLRSSNNRLGSSSAKRRTAPGGFGDLAREAGETHFRSGPTGRTQIFAPRKTRRHDLRHDRSLSRQCGLRIHRQNDGARTVQISDALDVGGGVLRTDPSRGFGAQFAEADVTLRSLQARRRFAPVIRPRAIRFHIRRPRPAPDAGSGRGRFHALHPRRRKGD